MKTCNIPSRSDPGSYTVTSPSASIRSITKAVADVKPSLQLEVAVRAARPPEIAFSADVTSRDAIGETGRQEATGHFITPGHVIDIFAALGD